MKLYHGSNVEIMEVDLSKCEKYKDFGQGFYTTTLEAQAWKMAHRTFRIKGWGTPTVTAFEAPDDLLEKPDICCRSFSLEPSVEWAIFVNNNRNPHFTDSDSPETNSDCKYDVVVGPVADDTVATLIRLFERGLLDKEALKRGFSFSKLTDQYTFHTPKALHYLKKVGVMVDGHSTKSD